jgi:hypothetical protein
MPVWARDGWVEGATHAPNQKKAFKGIGGLLGEGALQVKGGVIQGCIL